MSYSSALRMSGVAKSTVTSYYAYFREQVMQGLPVEERKIGGEDIEVEIDEANFGKVKYNRGHKVDEVWVIGGAE